jgi:hypothetical protein
MAKMLRAHAASRYSKGQKRRRKDSEFMAKRWAMPSFGGL